MLDAQHSSAQDSGATSPFLPTVTELRKLITATCDNINGEIDDDDAVMVARIDDVAAEHVAAVILEHLSGGAA